MGLVLSWNHISLPVVDHQDRRPLPVNDVDRLRHLTDPLVFLAPLLRKLLVAFLSGIKPGSKYEPERFAVGALPTLGEDSSDQQKLNG
jgi:hypothetical protein